MEKIKHRTIRFTPCRYRRSTWVSALAGVMLASMAVALCTMLIFILR